MAIPASVSAQDDHCQVEVTPRAAAGGSAFHFSGEGFTPTTVSLEHGRGAPTVHDLDLGGDDPWEFSIRSRTGDVGRWTAVFAAPHGCQAEVRFQVTLSNTATSTSASGTTETGSSIAAWAFALTVGLAGGLLIGRRVRFANPA